MNASQTIITILEFLLIAATFYGLFNEQKIIDFEEKIINKWRVRK